MCTNLVKHCPVCDRKLEKNEELIEVGKGSEKQYMCEECYEIDTTPISSQCDHCPEPATTNINGTDLCDDCADQWCS